MADLLHDYCSIDGVRLHYASLGSGPTVVLLHGFPETHRSWDLQLGALAEAGYRAVAPDLRGYGDSDWPKSGYDLDSLSRDVLGLLRHLSPEPVALIGHDWGGAITWHLAAHHPSALKRVVVLACPHPAALAEGLLKDADQRRRSWYMSFFQLPRVPERWLAKNNGRNLERMFRDTTPPQAREIVAAEREALLRPGALRGPLAYYRQALKTAARDLIARRQPVHVETPITLIWGEQDSCLGLALIERSRRLASRLGVHVLPDAGHFVHQERPEAVNALLLQALAETRA